MPFTPFHFGPGVLIKSLLRKYFSLSIFVFTQIVIDLETLYFILRGEYPLHRTLHTYLGTNIAILLVVVLGRPICQGGIRIWNTIARDLQFPAQISLRAAIFSAFIGAYSHVFFDSIMHSDVRPFYPFLDSNPFYRLISLTLLHRFCLFFGLIGLGIWGLSRRAGVKPGTVEES